MLFSGLNSSTYHVSKYILKQSFDDLTNYNVNDTFSFVNNITGFCSPDKYVLIPQIFGTPMGSPISPALVEIVLNQLFNILLPKLPYTIHLQDDAIP